MYFHWKTILLPKHIAEYVVVHEMVHLHEPHHTAEFWLRLERAMPDYAQRKSWLAEHGIEVEGFKALPWMGSFSLPGIRLYSLRRSPQILIECGPADAELASQRGFRFARFNTTP